MIAIKLTSEMLMKIPFFFGLFFSIAIVASGFQGHSQRYLTDQLLAEDSSQLSEDVIRFGDPVRGAIAFYRPELNCSKCHEPSANGRRLGPDLSEIRELKPGHLIQAILTPSREIRQGYETTQLLLDDGRQLAGIVVAEQDGRLQLDRIEEINEPLLVNLDQIEDRQTSNLSTMPEGLANQLGDRGEFLDLIRYLEEIARGGPTRAAQLRPTNALSQLAPLPEYESHVDHRGLIDGWNAETLKQGAEIFRLKCASCHGDRDHEGSMPTSLRFLSGKFKRGSDPHSMYLTLTHGYGMMIPQRWMVPQQKYAVIHYIRETFLRSDNPSQYAPINESYLAGLPVGDTVGPPPDESQPWTEMDYGASLFNTIEVSKNGTNIAQKGIAVRLDEGTGGVAAGSYWMMYEHDTLRVAGAWSGEFIDYNGIHFNGVHGQHPRIAGPVHFQNSTGPGWGHPQTGAFEDQRLVGRDDKRYGPLDRSWAQYLGLYRYGRQSILKYTVGTTSILESPSLNFQSGRPAFVRTLNIGPRDRELIVQLAESPQSFQRVTGGVLAKSSDSDQAPEVPFDGSTYFQKPAPDSWDTLKADFSLAARIRTRSDGTILCRTRDSKEWVPNGLSLFVRNGHPTLDIGWVGAVQANQRIDDGVWHNIALTWQHQNGQASFFVDGKPAGGGVIRLKKSLTDSVIRIGVTNDDFPDPSFFTGEIASAYVLARNLKADDLQDRQWGTWPDAVATWNPLEAPSEPGNDSAWTRCGSTELVDTPSGLFVTASDAQGTIDPNRFLVDEPGVLKLKIPSGPEPIRLAIQLVSLNGETDNEVMQEALKSPSIAGDLEPLTHGGPRNWPEEMETELRIDSTSGPFAVDTLTHPVDNPGDCRLRLTGLDFIPGTDAMVVSTWDGSVWRVTGVHQTQPGAKLRWTRIAGGLFQPLGIKIRDGVVFVTCRDQLVALHDLNADGEYDWYECFNSDHQVTEHFHEFAMGLQTDEDGNFYYAKSARHALPAVVPHHGTLLKVSADGERTEILANGFRAANGVCLNPDGSFVVTDQEGHWNPKNRINWVRGGGFYGNMFGYHNVTDPADDVMEPPLCWITNAFDRSPAELLWVNSERWGPLQGSLLNFSYGYGKIFVVPHEEVGSASSSGQNHGGQMQGAMCAFDLPQFPTGIMRGRFSSKDGQLYCCGMFAWSSTQEQPGGLFRVRYQGGPVRLPIGFHARQGTLAIEFTEPLEPQSANDPLNYVISAWDLKRSANYGSEHYNTRSWKVTAAKLQADGRTVLLEVPELAPTWGLEIVYALKTSAGQPFQNKLHGTINRLGE